MNSRTRLNLVLLLLSAAAALLVVYLPGLGKPAAPIPLTSLNAKQITRIQIQRSDQVPIQLVKQAQGWLMTTPFKLSANEMSVAALLELSHAPSLVRLAAKDHGLAKFKLAAPRVRLRLNDVDIAFGDTEPLAQQRYVLLGETVHLINETVYDKLIAPSGDWVSTALLPPDSRPLEIDLPGHTLAKQPDGRWVLTPPAPAVSMDAVNTLVGEWAHAQALQVKPYAKTVAQDQVLIRLQLRHDPIRFEIAARTPELILARPDAGVQYHLPAELAERLLKLPTPQVSQQDSPSTDAAAAQHVQ